MEPGPTRLFVGGVSKETSEDTLREHFSKYGKVMESLIIKNQETGRGKGFGFVTFTDSSMAHKALEDKHLILDKKVEVKPAKPKANRGSSVYNNNGDGNTQINTKKVFVGGLPPITEEEFKSYFHSFGTITDAVVMYDKNRPRGFGFITFDSTQAVDNVLKKNYYLLNGKVVEVKMAEPKGTNTDIYNGQYNSFGPSYYDKIYLVYAPWHGTHPYQYHCYCCYYCPYYGWWPASYGFGSQLNGFVPNQFHSHIRSYNVNDWASFVPNQVHSDYVNDSAGRRTTTLNFNLSNNNNNGRSDVKLQAVSNSPLIDDSSCKLNGKNDNGDLKLPVTANSLQIDNSSCLKSNGQEYQQGADGHSKPSDSLLIPNGTLD